MIYKKIRLEERMKSKSKLHKSIDAVCDKLQYARKGIDMLKLYYLRANAGRQKSGYGAKYCTKFNQSISLSLFYQIFPPATDLYLSKISSCYQLLYLFLFSPLQYHILNDRQELELW